MRLLTKIQDIKERIMEKNTYFNNGYAIAFNRGDGVYYNDSNGYINLLPNDTLGNYFYIRGNDIITHNTATEIANCLGYEYNDTLEITLVAVVKDADSGVLIENLRNTLSSIRDIKVTLSRTQYIREQVMINELRGVEREEVNKALQRLKNENIISITSIIQDTYPVSNCIIDPCKKCN